MLLLIILSVIMITVIIAVIVMYRNKEKKMISRLQDIIDNAIAGKYIDSQINETMISSLENSMNRFIEDCRVSAHNIEDQNNHIQTFISDISHQTLTPISNILLYSQLLQEKDEENIYHEEIEAIQEQAEKLNFLIDSLVKMSRLENGIIKVNLANNNIQDVLDSVYKQVKMKADEKNISLIINKTDVKAVFDKKWTVEAVYNIVDNAIKYTASCGKVIINVIPYSLFVRIDICDNGIGIAEEDLSKIFSRFYRSFSVSEEKGVGIGLYLARNIISMEGGYIKVKSELGRGSVFSIFLKK